jgi:hypothetical protein
MYDAMQHVGPIRSSAKEKLADYSWRTCSRWQLALIPVVSSSGMTYTNVASIPTEVHNVHDIHHPTERYLPSYLVIGASLQKVNCRK